MTLCEQKRSLLRKPKPPPVSAVILSLSKGCSFSLAQAGLLFLDLTGRNPPQLDSPTVRHFPLAKVAQCAFDPDHHK